MINQPGWEIFVGWFRGVPSNQEIRWKALTVRYFDALQSNVNRRRRENKGGRIRYALPNFFSSSLFLRVSSIKELSIMVQYGHVSRWRVGWALWSVGFIAIRWKLVEQMKKTVFQLSPPCLSSFQGWKDSCSKLHCGIQSVTIIRWEGGLNRRGTKLMRRMKNWNPFKYFSFFFF